MYRKIPLLVFEIYSNIFKHVIWYFATPPWAINFCRVTWPDNTKVFPKKTLGTRVGGVTLFWLSRPSLCFDLMMRRRQDNNRIRLVVTCNWTLINTISYPLFYTNLIKPCKNEKLSIAIKPSEANERLNLILYITLTFVMFCVLFFRDIFIHFWTLCLNIEIIIIYVLAKFSSPICFTTIVPT